MTLVMFFAPLLSGFARAQERDLPAIGGLGGGLLSDQMETEIGQQVMSSIRRSASQIHDPLVNEYLTSLVYQLVPYTPLSNRELTIVVIDDPGINAFAVPGNIVGVNGGLFLNARTEQQFGSVMAHELAHLSQRHFARRLEQQERSAPLTAAGIIAGIVLAAVTGSDAGLAAIMGTQAMSVQNMLAYSRSHEQEADRVGMEIMADAGLNPRGMPEMFETMMRQSRLQGNRVPEYLSTHPLTQSRVSDTRSRADQYQGVSDSDSLEYHLVRARLQVRFARNRGEVIDAFTAYLDKPDSGRKEAARYGLAVAQLANENAGRAREILEQLLAGNPNRITYQVTLAETLQAQGKLEQARELMQKALRRNPGNYPITDRLAHIETQAGNGSQAADYLRTLTREHPHREELWLRLAEAEGMARNIVGVHRARAEYDLLMGDLEAAQRQLRQAQERAPASTPLRQVISERLAEVSRRLSRS
ncbi:putative beta-barrel assembly-enhancing protease [Marinobacter zhanjiangensis]|uniref:Putative beta-barrel assembly-enhancing protease n=2 Tax=Marinobacter zhanjiangensis TaxID=578215 RepID=A0ABQ3BC49_9GAMM|nr:putative beta-barrel assembly-enhancing protease [Marinobacter zhanjiangensis]